MLTHETIQAYLQSGEDSFVEFKRDDVHPNSLARELVAFANTRGGTVLFGVDDDGSVRGVTKAKADEWIANIATNNCIPPLIPTIQAFQIAGKSVTAITVERGFEPHRVSDGKYYVRVGSVVREMTHTELARLFQQRQMVVYEETPVRGTGVTDLDFSLLKDYFLMNHGFDVMEMSETEQHQLFMNADLLTEDGNLTVHGLLLFGKTPQERIPHSAVLFAYFAGRERADRLHDRKRVTGTLKNQIDRAVDLLMLHLPVSSEIEGLERVEHHQIPMLVLREAIANAVIHRDYSIVGAEIQLLLFEERLEVHSPGALPNTVTIENMKVGKSVSRNPQLTRYFENIRYVERLGRGIPMVFREMKKLGRREPIIEANEGEVCLILFRT